MVFNRKSRTRKLPFPLSIVPTPPKEPGIPLIRSQMPFMLPLETILVCWPPLLNPYNFLSQIMTMMTLNIPSWATSLAVAGKKRGYCSRFHDGKLFFKKIVYIAPSSINKRVYYCHGPNRMVSQLRNSFIEHPIVYHFVLKIYVSASLLSIISLVGPFFLHFFSYWFFYPTLFQSFILICSKLTTCIVVIFFLNACHDSPPR